jgi:acyl-coenzyme A thioesterase PaaI-like protein
MSSVEQPVRARARVGHAIRRLGHAVIGHEADDDTLDRVADVLGELTAEVATGARRSRDTESYQRGDHWQAPPVGEEFERLSDRPVSGDASPWGLDPVVRRTAEGVEAVVTLGSAHEGAPGRSHGGIVSALFDDLFGFLLVIDETPAFTGELTIRYLRGTPLHVPLTCRLWVDSAEGRKVYMIGELIEPDGQVCARAKATFITIDPTTVPGWGDGV